MQILPGLGHTGSTPFDEQFGWYRSYRGLAGSVTYYVRWKGWNIWEHHSFPQSFQERILTLLLCNHRCGHEILYELLQSSSTISNPSASSSSSAAATSSVPMVDDINNSDGNHPLISVTTSITSPEGGERRRGRPLNIGDLPRHVIYYIMEFMVSFNTKYIICFKCFFDSIMIGLFLSLDI
jgi:hypothetical protein